MKTIQLGKSGVEVSTLCLGILPFGNRIGKEMSYHLMDRYVDAGGSFLDTANIYSFWIPGFEGGESETVLGQWMHDRKNRSRLFIASPPEITHFRRANPGRCAMMPCVRGQCKQLPSGERPRRLKTLEISEGCVIVRYSI